ncbi:hypothetical protein [Flavobacterium sp. ACN6]|uniref:hypothetical protein n=1 Tax=Flavobacterium sp. ACN6 TaxID=1920426 RepID=UPI001D711FD9|nr:hypothetical protein [Flavobacterium sp. ACN6]PBJ13167.1 hypothetical protein BSF42_15670 [Flavobacterium sp. ACN6]
MFVLINTQLSSAQQTVTLDETVFTHANASTFVSGETILFKIYCLKSSDKTPSTISKIAYVELVDESKKSVFKTKIALKNSTGQGDFFIPTTLKTGNYKLISYTTWMLNKKVSDYFQIDIKIINPFKAKDGAEQKLNTGNLIPPTTQTVSAVNTENTASTNPNVKFRLSKKAFANRELVDLKIESTNAAYEDGNYSLSVRKIDNLSNKNQSTAADFSSSSKETNIINLQNQTNKLVLPEVRGEVISGKITSKSGTDIINGKFVGLSLPGKSFTFEISQTDAYGNFIFYLKDVYYSSNITVQLLDEKAENYTLTLNDDPAINYTGLSFPETSDLSYVLKENIVERSIAAQIENAYFHKKVDNISKIPTLEPFYSPLAKQYVLDDYTRFKTLKETSVEVATDIFIRQKDGKNYLHVNDPSVFPQLPEPALVLVDGLYLENQNELMNYPMKNVYKIEVIIGRYYVGSKPFNGLISFTTFDKNFVSTQTGSSIVKTAILSPKPKKIYNKIEYANQTDEARIPDYRNQLFWAPEVKLNQTNNSFYTSDVSGNFEVRLEGFTKSGMPVSIKEFIEVKDASVN